MQTNFARKIAGSDQILEKRLILRIKAIERQVNKYKATMTEVAKGRQKVLTLVEVHPLLAAFRGNLGGRLLY